MPKPIRIQRKRTKGFSLPENTVCVDRSTKWGNPFKLQGDMIYLDCSHRRKILDPWVYLCAGDVQDTVDLYQACFSKNYGMGKLYLLLLRKKSGLGAGFFDEMNGDLWHWKNKLSHMDLTELRGKNLACWCPLDQPCHADVLIELANPIHQKVGV
ncbi:DUF4326 domain-containing protein [Gracilimonas sediminicola]|uniref:DUF4326 domain-containing protein n=1 Tax=Gracilimonas sediminicola TaxID=2952158 RepID=UPI0038D4B4BD